MIVAPHLLALRRIQRRVHLFVSRSETAPVRSLPRSPGHPTK